MTKNAFLIAALVCAAGSAAQAQSSPRVYSPQFDNEAVAGDAPAVQLWLDDRSLGFGDIIRPFVVTEEGAYLTVIRVSTDGELRVLYPARPSQQQRYREGMFPNDRLPVTSVDQSFYVKESAGSGFVFAIASFDRFNYSYYATGNQWSYARLANASRFGNPFQIARSFIEEVTAGGGEYSMDYVMYDVDGILYRSRYATRYRHYAFNDYLDLCLGAFDAWYTPYCRAYNGGYYGPYIIVNYPSQPGVGSRKNMRVKPLVPDPVLPHRVRTEPQPAEGRFPVTDPAETAAEARRERMLRDARPRIEPKAEPMSEPRIYRPERDPVVSRPAPRSEPRIEAPRPPPQRTPRRRQ